MASLVRFGVFNWNSIRVSLKESKFYFSYLDPHWHNCLICFEMEPLQLEQRNSF